MSLDLEDLLPWGRRNYYIIQFLRCSDILIRLSIQLQGIDSKSKPPINTFLLTTNYKVLTFILIQIMSCIVGCLAYCCCDILCCQCNSFIFPAPRVSEYEKCNEDCGIWEFKTFISQGRNVPYFKLYNQQSEQSKKCFIYFHGNGEDVGYLGYFLQPIFDSIKITFYAIEYPTYGEYNPQPKALISNKIKQDSINFYSFLIKERNRSKDDIYVIGRSIGSGGAIYLSAHRPIPLLILISPFDSIKKVAKQVFGCLGSLVKEHFNNQEQIVNVKGKVLLIHGEKDQVIGVSHARNLIRIYEQKNEYKNTAVTVYPPQMTHNKFLMGEDIITHIARFLKIYA